MTIKLNRPVQQLLSDLALLIHMIHSLSLPLFFLSNFYCEFSTSEIKVIKQGKVSGQQVN